MIKNAPSKGNLLRDLWAKKENLRELTYLQSTKTLHNVWLWTLHAFFTKELLSVSWVWTWSPVSELTVCVCARCPAAPAQAAPRSMRLSKHSTAAGAHSQGWGREEGMRLGGNKSKFLRNDLTGNDRVSASYNHTVRERERAGEVLPKHRVVPDLSRWGWWNNKAFPVCVFH